MADPVLGPIADGDTFKIILFQTLYNQSIMNVLHYVCSATGGAPPDRFTVCKELAAAMNVAVTGIATQMRGFQSEDLTHTIVRTQWLKEIDRSYAFWEEPVNESGGVLTPAALSNIAVSIEKRAQADPLHPREGIGRLQMAGVPNNKYTGGLFDPAYLASMSNWLEDLTDSITLPSGPTMLPCLARAGATLWLDSPIFQCTVKDTVRVMNRRTVGRGQ